MQRAPELRQRKDRDPLGEENDGSNKKPLKGVHYGEMRRMR